MIEKLRREPIVPTSRCAWHPVCIEGDVHSFATKTHSHVFTLVHQDFVLIADYIPTSSLATLPPLCSYQSRRFSYPPHSSPVSIPICSNQPGLTLIDPENILWAVTTLTGTLDHGSEFQLPGKSILSSSLTCTTVSLVHRARVIMAIFAVLICSFVLASARGRMDASKAPDVVPVHHKSRVPTVSLIERQNHILGY